MTFPVPPLRAAAWDDARRYMPAGPSHIYVYYRVAADTAAARRAVGVLLSEIETATGVRGHLLARCEDPATWMEIYEPIDDIAHFSQMLATVVDRHDIAAIAIDRKRHTECFAALPAAAVPAT